MANLVNLLTLGAVQWAVVRQGEVRVIERRGKFSRVAEAGVTMLVSLWGYGETIGRFNISRIVHDQAGNAHVVPRQNVEIISTRTMVDDYPKESIITRDNATVNIDAVVYYRVFDPAKAVYQVNDYVMALQKLVQSALRDECGKYELDQLLVSRDQINTALRTQLDVATDPWGIKVERVEIKDIDLGEFGAILAEQRSAETRRRTEITQAEGRKRAAVLEAEGYNESNVLKAKGEKEAAILRAEATKAATVLEAEGEAEALMKLREAEAKSFALLAQVLNGGESSEHLLKFMTINKAGEIAGKLAAGNATKVFLPADPERLFGLRNAEAVGPVAET